MDLAFKPKQCQDKLLFWQVIKNKTFFVLVTFSQIATIFFTKEKIPALC